MLKDLSIVIRECQKKWNSLLVKKEIKLQEPFKSIFAKEWKKSKEETIYINDYSIIYTNTKDQSAHFPSTWFYYAYAYAPLLKELEKYKIAFDKIINNIQEKMNLDTKSKDNFLKELPRADWDSSPQSKNWSEGFYEELKSLSENEQSYLTQYISNPDWWIKSTSGSSGRKLNRNDLCRSILGLSMNVIITSSDKLYDVIRICAIDDVKNALQELLEPQNLQGKNIIYYGAPGTGKSHQIEQLIQGSNYRRTVFHSDTQNSDFIGMLKPHINGNNCSYIFMPGPFILSYIDAIKTPQTHHYLIIEELNRAHAAMVFGEIFQLLDRDENGNGCYKIEPTDQSLIEYLKTELNINQMCPIELQMPRNLSILATMNSSDQAVTPLDTAFKRRWEFEYIRIDMEKAPEQDITIPNNNKMTNITWKKLATEINNRLSENSIPEDRHLGPFFLSKNEINEKGLTNKLFIYLWDDLLRHQSKTILFNPEIKTFSQLIRYSNDRKDLFCPELQEKLF